MKYVCIILRVALLPAVPWPRFMRACVGTPFG